MWGVPRKGPDSRAQKALLIVFLETVKVSTKLEGGSLSQLLSHCHLKGAEAEKERLLISEFLFSAPCLIYYVTSGKYLPVSGPWFPRDNAQSLL